MAWNDDEYTRGRDELLDRTVRRGEQLRRRRRLPLMGIAPLALLLIAVPAALSLSGGDGGGRTTVAASGPSPTTTSPPATTAVKKCRADLTQSMEGDLVVCRNQAGEVMCEAPLFMLAANSCPPDTSAITTIPPLPNRPPPPTTANRAGTITPSGSTTTVPYCAPGQLTLGPATTDMAVYRIGLDEILVQATAINRSGRACADPSSSTSISVRDASGALVYGVAVIADSFGPLPAIQPGDQFPVYMYWDQRIMGGNNQRAGAGAYTATVSLGQTESAPASFRLVAP